MNVRALLPGEDASLHFDRLPPLSLYVHLPWCVRKCPYCDFNSYEATRALPRKLEYVDALLRDCAPSCRSCQGASRDGVHRRRHAEPVLGGRDPPAARRRYARDCRSQPDVEITLEANPGAVDAARFAAYPRRRRQSRLSIGIQSFRGEQLRALGRVHDADEARAAVPTARAAGFDNVNHRPDVRAAER